MGTRRLALLRAREGPWVPTGYMPKPEVRITGLKNAVVRVVQKAGGAMLESEQEFTEDGTFALQQAEWTRVFCEPHCKSVICVLTSSSAV